jgi:hypothetical protein
MYQFVKAFFAAVISAIAANSIILYIARPMVIDPAMPLHALSLFPVVSLTAIGGIAATSVYAVMRSTMRSPNKAYIWISVIALIISFVPDYMIIGMTSGPFAGATLPSALVLMLMHIAAAVCIVLSLTNIWGARSQPHVSM